MCLCKGEKDRPREHDSLEGLALRGQSPWGHQSTHFDLSIFHACLNKSKKVSGSCFHSRSSCHRDAVLGSERIFLIKQEGLQSLPWQTSTELVLWARPANATSNLIGIMVKILDA